MSQPNSSHIEGGIKTSPSRIIWITGVSGTLGTALATAFLSAGDRVVGIWNRHEPGLIHERLHPLQFNLAETSAEKLDHALAALPASLQVPDALILNAGINQDKLLVQTRAEQWDETLLVNLKSAFPWIRRFSRSPGRPSPRHVVAISSFAARHGHAGQSAYVASKAALIGLIQSAARELAADGICCNVVLPGLMESRMTREMAPEQRAALVEMNLLRILNEPSEVASFVVHLCGMRQVSGQIFQLDSRLSPWT